MVNKSYEQLTHDNPVNKGLSFHYVDSVITKIVRVKYPDIATITSLEHQIYKRRVGNTHSTFIYSYYVTGTDLHGQGIRKHLIYSAHSDNSRLTAYTNMKRLIKAGFNKRGNYRIATPLDFIPETKAMIYEAVDGINLYQYITGGTQAHDLKNIILQAAHWIKKFHRMRYPQSLMKKFTAYDAITLNPSTDSLLQSVKEVDAQQSEKLQSFVDTFLQFKKKLATKFTSGIVYGDFHPENIISENLRAKGLTMIDFTDVTRGDQLRDIGSFIQQLHFMSQDYYTEKEVNELRAYFLKVYFGKNYTQLSSALLQRINLYQAWNALRGFTWFFYNSKKRPSSYGLLEDAWLYLTLAKNKETTFSIN